MTFIAVVKESRELDVIIQKACLRVKSCKVTVKSSVYVRTRFGVLFHNFQLKKPLTYLASNNHDETRPFREVLSEARYKECLPV